MPVANSSRVIEVRSTQLREEANALRNRANRIEAVAEHAHSLISALNGRSRSAVLQALTNRMLDMKQQRFANMVHDMREFARVLDEAADLFERREDEKRSIAETTGNVF